MDIKTIYWIAGLLEGEGCFTFNNGTPTIQLKMTDLDVIEKFKSLTHIEGNIFCEERSKLANSKPCYSVKIFGGQAISWMMTLYPLMSLRRRAKITQTIKIWMDRKSPERMREKTIKSLMKAGLTRETAILQADILFSKN